jgi:hypothetical protein
MAELPEGAFDGPIPGMGLTAEVGGRPWQQPPRFATVEETLSFYIPRITSDEMYEEMLDLMELGIPVTTIADTIQTGGVMEGMHSLDVGVLVTPVIIEMLVYMAEDADIEYELGMESKLDKDKISDTKIGIAMKKMREKMPEAVEEAKENVLEETADEAEAVPSEPTSLMARRT